MRFRKRTIPKRYIQKKDNSKKDKSDKGQFLKTKIWEKDNSEGTKKQLKIDNSDKERSIMTIMKINTLKRTTLKRKNLEIYNSEKKKFKKNNYGKKKSENL